jgi:hypothetical protein
VPVRQIAHGQAARHEQAPYWPPVLLSSGALLYLEGLCGGACRATALHEGHGADRLGPAEVATAAEMYRAMEMPFWLEKAEAALAKSGAA